MSIAKIIGAQRDFSAGELDVSMKRADENPVMKTGARQMSNWRITNSKIVSNRPGRTALFFETGRVDEVLMSPGNIFFIAFGAGYLRVYNAAGTRVFASFVKGDGLTSIPWTANTVKDIVAVNAAGSTLQIFIFYADGAPNNVPQILTWDGVSQSSTWTLTTFAETITSGNQKRTPFYRISPQNVTMQPSATTGNVNVTFSMPILIPGTAGGMPNGMVGTYFRFCGRQLKITAVTQADFTTPATAPSQYGTATVEESLPPGQNLTVASNAFFNLGDEVIGSSSGAKGIVTGFASGQVGVQLLQVSSTAATSIFQSQNVTVGFTTADHLVTPGGSTTI